ncbi:MAG: succinate dehydrogenase cytochrome b subunit [Chitinophagales bacterium]|nr:succinate dehydrogenase cytochrome b subunit [Chitinophagales bacterium]
MAKSYLLDSSVGKKVIVGLTGLFLISFLVVHVGINSLILVDIINPDDNGDLFNSAAHFMSHFWLIRIMEIGLLLGLIAHIALTLKLTLANRENRPVGYAVSAANTNSKWYSRSMAVLGSLLLMFLVVHMSDFWLDTKKALYVTGEPDNPFLNVIHALSNPILLVIYLVGIGSLAFHLMHGFPSAFQSLGLNHKKYTPIIKCLGTAFSIIVPALFAIIALAVFLGLVKP